MAATTTEAGSTRSRLVVAAAFACLAAVAVLVAMLAPAEALKPTEIGKTSHKPKASCPTPDSNNFPPKKGCQAFGEVTGFQVKADGKQDLMKMPADGRIVAWAVQLSKPNKSEQTFFRRVLGNRGSKAGPSARLALLTHAHESKFRLRAQSPNVGLSQYLGRRQYFTLRKPIAVKKNWIAGLTSKTWIPNFAHDLHGDDKWKASRTKNRCESFRDKTKRSRPHQKKGSTRAYGCTYSHARMLYWAYFVKN